MTKETENIVEDIKVQDEVTVKDDKPTTSKKTKASVPEKECDVLLYNAIKKTVIISFDGFGYELKNVMKNPGKKLTVKYYGKIGNSNFKIELK